MTNVNQILVNGVEQICALQVRVGRRDEEKKGQGERAKGEGRGEEKEKERE